MTDKLCEIKREILKSIPDHQTLLSFQSDEDNEMFQYWWNNIGKFYFEDYLEKTLI